MVMAAQESSCRNKEPATEHVVIIFGVTGLVGQELARKLISKSVRKVYGIARNPETRPIHDPNFHFISCDLLDPSETQQKLSVLQDVTHMFWVTWASQFPLDSQECCEQNKVMMANALNAILPTAFALKHVSLQTGTKHYVSLRGQSKENNKNNEKEVCYYDEEWPRVSTGYNFYYTLEDLLRERLGGKVAWSVHRPGLLMGCSQRTLFNFMGSLCVYGTICRRLNLPFVFGGTRECWEKICIDGSDARLVAEQHIWAATTDETYSSNGQAFNAINGSSFTWKEIWPAIRMKFEADVSSNEETFSEDFFFTEAMGDKGGLWEEIVEEEGLLQTQMEDLANWAFLDALFRCPVKMLGTRDKADRLGFNARYGMRDSVLYWIDFMRDEKLIP